MSPLIKVDSNKCTGCHLCELACSIKHYKSFGIAYRIKINSDHMEGTNHPMLCRQCQEPLCIKACKINALSLSTNKTIFVNNEVCTKCGSCVAACPFNAISFDGKGDIVVCDLCNGYPACVEICPADALYFNGG